MSNSSSGESEMPSGPAMHPPTDGFTITPQDTDILRGYVEEFENADSQMRNKILETSMGELYKLRPANSTFDKKQAKKVCIQRMHISTHLLIYFPFRKSESGSITTTQPLIVE
jgi:hypothetical protein